ncbi:hypothetical protein HYC85_015695 [Camellia sinensis]|uniref:Uncharacterized protein n=1 Tax=Camellia sinensis TaxID=4442 RepID=A0A7J7GYM1_CAMSI|nr:hypothetical protein HYC85_015695 [Camellia sinensis]
MFLMTMPSGNMVASDKMQFPAAAAGGGGGAADLLHHRQWFPDERDVFISWLRGEFAAANAIIDSLCNHLSMIGEPGEYDGVNFSIQQRRCNWSPVLQMQQYFSIAEVLYSLQQVAWRRHSRFFDPVKVPGKEYKRSGFGSRQGQRVEYMKESHNSNNVEYHRYDANVSGNLVSLEKGDRVVEKGEEAKLGGEVVNSDDKVVAVAEDKKVFGVGADVVPKPQADSCVKSSGNSQGTTSSNSEVEVEGHDAGCASDSKGPCNVPMENDSHSIQTPHEKQNLTIIPKTCVGTEILGGKAVNVVDGMKLYEELLDASEVSKLVLLVNDLRAAGKRGQFQGKFPNAFLLVDGLLFFL